MEKFKDCDGSEFFKLNSIKSYMEGHKGFIAGGAFKSIFSSKPFKDVDVFFESEKDFEYAVSYFKSKEGFIKLYENTSAICFKKQSSNVKVDLVKSTFGMPSDIISRFDFTVSKFAYYKSDSDGENTYKCLYHSDFFDHLINKKLVIDDSLPFPVGTFERAFRYTKYGFGLCRESKAKLIEALQQADISDLSNDLYFGFD